MWKSQYVPVVAVVSGPSAYGLASSGPYSSFVECPTGYNVTGGGTEMTHWEPGGTNSPDTSMPYFNGTLGKYTGWSVTPGGDPKYNGWSPFAVCAK